VEVVLPYGQVPLRFEAGDRHIEVLRAPVLPPARPIAELLDEALAAERPVVAEGARVTLIVSDATRNEPRDQFVAALRRVLPTVRWTLAVATGTHGACDLTELGIPAEFLAAATVVNHDGHDPRDLVELGVTAAGTPMRVHRCVIDADLVVLTGCIRPHYFAGFGAGAKAIFPGLGEATAIRVNHKWKTSPMARAGIVEGNPCRDDIEEAVRMVRTPTFLLNGVTSPDYEVRAIVTGDIARAFRAGCDLARPWFTVRAQRAPVVIASDSLPVTAALYQAAKIGAAVAPLLEPGGTLVIAAECPEGVGPLETVNEAIFRIGILPRLPLGARIVLVSGLAREVVDQTLVEYAARIEDVIGQTNRILVVPKASQLLCNGSK
jgi:nickel-dependent lactate racemase